MAYINFFDSVVFSNQIKTTSQQALEAVDEYFYLGDKFRVSIFTPDAEHSKCWAMLNQQDRYRSWKNIAIKVASYCTLILPLLALFAKVALRWYLQISSIEVMQKAVPGSVLEARMPTDLLKNIGGFLSYQDQGQWAQAALFARDAVRKAEQSIVNIMAPLKAEIEALPQGPISDEDFKRLLVGLVTSSAVGHPKHWAPVMDALMGHYLPQASNTVGEVVQAHAHIADLLATSEQPISSNQIYQFCRYLGQNQLEEFMPWAGYRALEQYLLKLQPEGVNRALEEYLIRQAKKLIKANDREQYVSGERILKYQTADVDPREWFGCNGNDYSLWKQPGVQNGEMSPMPGPLLEALWTHIQSLQAACVDRPFRVSMMGRAEAALPHNFTLPLAQRITSADIYLDHSNTIDIEAIENQGYARRWNWIISEEQATELAERYPTAIVIED